MKAFIFLLFVSLVLSSKTKNEGALLIFTIRRKQSQNTNYKAKPVSIIPGDSLEFKCNSKPQLMFIFLNYF